MTERFLGILNKDYDGRGKITLKIKNGAVTSPDLIIDPEFTVDHLSEALECMSDTELFGLYSDNMRELGTEDAKA